MYFNYASLRHALDILAREWNNLDRTGSNSYNKIYLVWLLIGVAQRRLLGVDRCMLAQGLYHLLKQDQPFTRTYKFNNFSGDYPISDSEHLHGNYCLGRDYAIDIYGGHQWVHRNDGQLIGNLMANKKNQLSELMPIPANQESCVIF